MAWKPEKPCVQCVPSSQLSITVLLDVLLPLGQHVIEWVMTYTLSYTLDPLFLLVWCGCRHAVDSVLPLHHLAFAVCLASLDEVRGCRIQLKAIWFIAILDLTNLNILQWNDSPGLLVSCVLKVVEAVVVEDEPPPLPGLVAAALLHEPPLTVGVEEGVHEIVPIILWDLEGLSLDAFVEALQQLPWQVISIVNASVHGDELLNGLLVLDGWVVKRGIQHDDCKGQHKASVRVLEDGGVELTVAVGKSLHHPVNLLSLAR